MTDLLTAVPILDSPELRRCLRQRCPHDAIVRLATNDSFSLLRVEAMARRWITFLVRRAYVPACRRVYLYEINFEPTTGEPLEAGFAYLFDAQ